MGSEPGHLSNPAARVAAITDGGGFFCGAIGRVLGRPGVKVPLPEIRIEGRGLLG